MGFNSGLKGLIIKPETLSPTDLVGLSLLTAFGMPKSLTVTNSKKIRTKNWNETKRW